ncbi:MAG: carbohydrate ABC transporter permease [Treponema sp.]|jgi:putative aldouronate transport system permease protein|nr:carbohydrate ABC transporter permease [Treponema sp.]
MSIHTSPSRRIFVLANTLLLIMLGFVFLAPVMHVAFASISDPVKLNIKSGLIFWPLGKPTLEGYRIVLASPNIAAGYMNTLFYVLAGTGISMILTVTGAYCLSRKSFALRNPIMLFISFTMLFNGGLMPSYMVVRNLGLYNSRWAVIIPTAVSVFNLIIMRTSFLGIPASLEEAAKIDGANDVQTMFYVILPVSKAVIAVIGLFYAVGLWNSWFPAMIYLRDRTKFPLQLILREILLINDTSIMNSSADATRNISVARQLVKYCTIMTATVPILCVYPFIQKYFAKGVMIGSIKG